MVLSELEESLFTVLRGLPPREAGQILNWARQLADVAGEQSIDWSDAWTDEDLVDATAAALSQFEFQEQGER